jgi:putative peptidoglycan lipid II flippase
MQAFTRWLRRQSTWIESQQTSILSAAFIILAATIASAVFGLLKNRVLGAYFINGQYSYAVGDTTHYLLESYWVAFRIPEFAYQLIILGAVSSAFLPLFTQLYKDEKSEAFNLANQAMLILFGIFGLAGVVIGVWADGFVNLITGPGFDQTQHALAVEMTRIMMLAQVLFALSGFFSAMLQSAKRFIIPAFSPVMYNVGIILMVIFAHRQLGLPAAAWGTVLGAFLHMIIQLPLAWKLGWRLDLWPRWRRADLLHLTKTAGPRTLTMGLNQLNLLAITFFTTTVGGLSLTLVTYAQALMSVPIRFFGASIGQAALPFLSASHDDLEGFRSTTFRSLRQIAFFAAPASVLLLVLRVPIVRLAYGTHDLPWRATLLTAETLGFLSLSVAPQAATHLLIRAFYALNNTVTPFLVSIFYFLATLFLGWLLVIQLQLGLKGIAIALTVTGTLEMFLLLTLLVWRIRLDGVKELAGSLFRIGLAAFLMAVALFIFQRLFDLYVFETSRTLALLQLTVLVTAIGSASYLGLCWLFRIEELRILHRIYLRLRSQWTKTVRTTPEFMENVSAES